MAHLGVKLCVTHATPESRISVKIASYWSASRGANLRKETPGIAARDARIGGTTVVGTLSGSVREGGVPVPNCVVRCYERSSGNMVLQVRTDSLGEFDIPGVQKTDPNYYVVALDPDGGALYNALIFDRVIPV